MRRVVLLLLIGGPLGCSGTPGPSIKLGLNLDSSGSQSGRVLVVKPAIQAAVQLINSSGGVAGHPLELVDTDNTFSPEVAAMIAQNYAARGDIAAMIGCESTPTTLAVVPAVKAGQLVTITGHATGTALATRDDGGFLFRSVGSLTEQTVALAKYLTETAQITQIAFAYQNDSLGTSWFDSFVREFSARGGTITGSVSFRPNFQTDQEAADVLMRIAALSPQPDNLMLYTFPADGTRLIQKWVDSVTLPQLRWWFGSPMVVNTFAMTRPQLQGMKGLIGYHATGPAYQALATAYQRVAHKSVDDAPLAANDWDAVLLVGLGLVAQAHQYPGERFGGLHLRDAIRQIGSTPAMGMPFSVDLGWRTAVAALNTDMAIDYEGASGHCDFDAVNDVKGPVAIYRIDNGAWVVDTVYDESVLTPMGR